MPYSKDLRSPVLTMYLASFICGKTTSAKVKEYLEELFFKEVKPSNLSIALSTLEQIGYITRVNDPSSSRYGQIIYGIRKDKILSDILDELNKVTSRFTYSFRLDGKLITRQKSFSFNERCSFIREKLQIDGSLSAKIIFDAFSGFCMDAIILYSDSESICRKDKEFSYFSLIRNFILGFSVDESFSQDYNSYLSDKQFLGVEGGGLTLESELKEFSELCRIYSSLLNVTDLTMMARNRIEKDIRGLQKV